MHAIRVTDYNGDVEEVFFVGPYPDSAARDLELERLASTTQLDAGYAFEAATPAAVTPARSVDPAKLAAVTSETTEDDLADILWA